MHTAAFRSARIDAIYTPFDVPRAVIGPILRGLILSGVEGLNVTVPLKEAVIPLMDRLDPVARMTGAVNTIVIRNRRTIGYNTDVAGFESAIRELGLRQHPAKAVVLGAGGAARAVALVLASRAGSELTIANRHIARAKMMARWLRRIRPRVSVRALSLREVALDKVDVLVNATSVGLRKSDRPLIDLETLPREALVYDLIYHRQTPLVRTARRRGCVAANGLSMLLYQGAESFRLWLRHRPPIGAMRRALERAVQSEK